MNRTYEKTKQGGFTLIELLVAMALFSLLIGTIMSMFFTSLRGQEAVFHQQILIDQNSYAAEYMSRAIRQAQKATDGTCIADTTNYQTFSGESEIRFIDKNGDCRKFYLDAGTGLIMEDVNGIDPLNLTSDNLDVQNLLFVLQGEIQTDNIQPRVTFLIDSKARDALSRLRLHTTISQRRFDIVE